MRLHSIVAGLLVLEASTPVLTAGSGCQQPDGELRLPVKGAQLVPGTGWIVDGCGVMRIDPR